MNLRNLAKDTAIYGLSSIVGRFLNYLLVPLHTGMIAASSGGYGIVSNLYAYTALLLAFLTFGMETTLFRFSNKDGENADIVYGTTLRMVGTVAILFIAAVLLLLNPVSAALGYSDHPEYVACMALIVGMDAFQAIMFSRLRQQGKALKFMGLKFAFIIPNVIFNLVIFLLLPRFFTSYPELAAFYSRMNDGVGLIFFANLLCTAGVTAGFAAELKGLSYGFDRGLCKRMLAYSWPLLILSLVGNLNQAADKILYPNLVPGPEGMVQLGIYGACVKIAMIMSLLTQAFRYAYEPIVFNGSRDKNNPRTLADGMKWFIAFTVLAFCAVVVYMPVLKHFIAESYWEGLDVVPTVMLAEIFMGIYFNLSFWYKLTDKTLWGAVMSASGAAVMIAVNIIFVPTLGYRACALGGLAGYGTAMLMSWIIGKRHFSVPYDYKSMGLFAACGGIIYFASTALREAISSEILQMAAGTVLLLAYSAVLFILIRPRKGSDR